MKKNLAVYVCFLVLTVSVFGQNIDKNQYKAIDPFDYKLEEDYALNGTRDKKYKSVVEFVSEIKESNTTSYKFISLDKHTPLTLFPNPSSRLRPPSPGQTVTIYYTMNKRGGIASVELDAYDDNKNKDERGLGVQKSAIPQSSPNIRKSEYKSITTDDYMDDAMYTQEGDDDRKFKSTLQFVSQEGILFKFTKPDDAAVIPIPMKVWRRYPIFTAGQKMIVYFTASKEYKDFLRIDDIELMR